MGRRVVAAMGLVFGSVACAASLDPVFSEVSFDQLFEKHGQTHFRWASRVFATGLSNHQRQRARIEFELEGAEIARRGGNGEVLMLVQFEDGSGDAYQVHSEIPLEGFDKKTGADNVTYRHDAFVKPGDYRVSLAIFITGTGEHATNRMMLHIDPVAHDPFPEMWTDASAVEFVPILDAPEAWFLPDVTTRPTIHMENRRAVNLDVMVVEPRVQRMGRRADQNMRALIPSLKLIAQIQLKGTMNVALLDLERRRVSFEQAGVRTIDWEGLKAGLAETSPHKIDVKDLQNRYDDAQFFVSQVRRRAETARAAEGVCAVIVLSTPMSFNDDVDLNPISVREAGCRIFFVRYDSRPEQAYIPLGRGGRGSLEPRLIPSDSLASTLKPMDPKIFDVHNAEEFRRALAAILAEISKIAA